MLMAEFMPTTNLAIAAASFVQFDYNGWPAAKKDELELAVRQLPVVTSVIQAGGRSSIQVHFDPDRSNAQNLILAVNQVADRVLTGYNFTDR